MNEWKISGENEEIFGMDLIGRWQHDWQEGWLYKLEGRESKWQLCIPFHKGETKFQKTLDLISFHNGWLLLKKFSSDRSWEQGQMGGRHLFDQLCAQPLHHLSV